MGVSYNRFVDALLTHNSSPSAEQPQRRILLQRIQLPAAAAVPFLWASKTHGQDS